MFAFCVVELGFSEDAAYNRINVARAARRLPAIFDTVRSGQIHLSGLRVLLPHLTDENHEEVLAQAAGKSKRDIEELVARLAPKPPVPTVIRKLPERAVQPALTVSAPAVPTPKKHRPEIAPLSAETYKIQFTASRGLRDKLRQAQDLLRHRVPAGDPAVIFEKALDLLIERVKKERFAIGRKARKTADEVTGPADSEDTPDPIKRIVFERDGGRCTFVDEHGRRCPQTGGLEFDHIEGFARTHVHDPDLIRLLCRAHNQHAAEQLYGRVFMERMRNQTRPGASSQARLFVASLAHEPCVGLGRG